MKKHGQVDDGNITLLAKGVEMKGEIRVEGTVRIDGRLEGEIYTKGQVIVGEDGIVKGTISAGVLISSGRIKANVTASERVQLLKTALLMGEVHAPVLAMEEGAKFQGISDMGVTAWPDDTSSKPTNAHARDGASPRSRPVALIAKEADL